METREIPAPGRPRPVVLCVLDGWGHSTETEHNAIAQAATPVYDRLMRDRPHATLETSGPAVGLPEGQMGNSEVGHMNLGGGRVVVQDLPRIDEAIAEGELARNPVLQDLIGKLRASGATCHLMGLTSPGGVHSHQDHIIALARTLDDNGVAVAIHAFLDGRDTPPSSAAQYVGEVESGVRGLSNVHIATVSGRYYAMDRDQRWDRTARAYECLVAGTGERAENAAAAVAASYKSGVSDEFVVPTAIGGHHGMTPGDALLVANFRADRVRQLLGALTLPDFSHFERSTVIRFDAAVGMVEYSSELDRHMAALFRKRHLAGTIGDIVSRAGLTQLRIAETEKYAHVTFFFNGGEEQPSRGETRILVPSPKVATYDLKPEMSAIELTDRLTQEVADESFDFIVVNYANPDMVGHTGNMAAAIGAVETVDGCMGRVVEAIESVGGALLITADHGNIERMRDAAGSGAHTAHTTNPVPVILAAGTAGADMVLADGRLADVAPTLLELMGLDQSAEMTGRSLLRPREQGEEPASGSAFFSHRKASA